MSDPLDPTGMSSRRANVRGNAQTHGAATDGESIWAFVRATTKRRADSAKAAVRVGLEPRGYTTADHERSEALRGEAARLRQIAAGKTVPEQRRLVECEAQRLEEDAEEIVPLVHARAGWR